MPVIVLASLDQTSLKRCRPPECRLPGVEIAGDDRSDGTVGRDRTRLQMQLHWWWRPRASPGRLSWIRRSVLPGAGRGGYAEAAELCADCPVRVECDREADELPDLPPVVTPHRFPRWWGRLCRAVRGPPVDPPRVDRVGQVTCGSTADDRGRTPSALTLRVVTTACTACRWGGGAVPCGSQSSAGT